MANPDDLIDIDGLSTFLDGCDSRFAATGHTHTPASIGAAAASHTHTSSDVTDLGEHYVSIGGDATDGSLGWNASDSRGFFRVDGTGSDAHVVNWDSNGPYGSDYDGTSWTTTWDLRNAPVVVRQVDFTIGRTRGSSKSVTAPTVSGYTFVCWGQVATDGWIAHVYPAAPFSMTCSFFVSVADGTGNGTCHVVAIYVRN